MSKTLSLLCLRVDASKEPSIIESKERSHVMNIMKHEELSFRRSNNSKIIPSNCTRSTSSLTQETEDISHQNLLIKKNLFSFSSKYIIKTCIKLSTLLLSFLKSISFPKIPTCKWLTIPKNFSTTPTLGSKVIGTIFGHRRGRVNFAVQFDPRCEPILLLELAISTSNLIKDMSTGLVRIALECEKAAPGGVIRLFNELLWTMYCNGRNCGYAVTRACTESDWHVLRTVQSVSVGAGVIPVGDDGRVKASAACREGELLYMRAKFERVVGSRDSEAFYMLNPDSNGGPELSIFLLRV